MLNVNNWFSFEQLKDAAPCVSNKTHLQKYEKKVIQVHFNDKKLWVTAIFNTLNTLAISSKSHHRYSVV